MPPCYLSLHLSQRLPQIPSCKQICDNVASIGCGCKKIFFSIIMTYHHSAGVIKAKREKKGQLALLLCRYIYFDALLLHYQVSFESYVTLVVNFSGKTVLENVFIHFIVPTKFMVSRESFNPSFIDHLTVLTSICRLFSFQSKFWGRRSRRVCVTFDFLRFINHFKFIYILHTPACCLIG